MVSAKRCSPTMARRELKIGLTSEISSGVNKVTASSQSGRLVISSLGDSPEESERPLNRRYKSTGTTSQKAQPSCRAKSPNIDSPGFFTHAAPSPEFLI